LGGKREGSWGNPKGILREEVLTPAQGLALGKWERGVKYEKEKGQKRKGPHMIQNAL